MNKNPANQYNQRNQRSRQTPHRRSRSPRFFKKYLVE